MIPALCNDVRTIPSGAHQRLSLKYPSLRTHLALYKYSLLLAGLGETTCRIMWERTKPSRIDQSETLARETRQTHLLHPNNTVGKKSNSEHPLSFHEDKFRENTHEGMSHVRRPMNKQAIPSTQVTRRIVSYRRRQRVLLLWAINFSALRLIPSCIAKRKNIYVPSSEDRRCSCSPPP